MVGESTPYVSHAAIDFARIYDAYHAKVRAYAAKLIGRDDADDIAQEVFLKVSRALDTLADPARLSPWIYSITLNTVRDTAAGARKVGKHERIKQFVARVCTCGHRASDRVNVG